MSILERGVWTDKSIGLFVHDVIEYDMKDGGLSIIKEENLLPPSMIKQLEKTPKGLKRNSAIGKLKHDPKFQHVPKLQNELFKKYRLMFGEANELTDHDILSVRKDAIFTKRYCYELQFGKYITFAEKNVYQLYFVLTVQDPHIKGNRRLEFLWSENGYIHVKGMKDDVLEKHKDYTLQVLWRIGKYLVQFDKQGALRYLIKFMSDYKFLRLNPEYYRGFNDLSIFPVHVMGRDLLLDEIGESMLPDCDISYNYIQIYTQLLNLICQ